VNQSTAIAFMRRLRAGLDSGLELPEALTMGATALPRDARHTVERILDRLDGDYPEDEWGFDEDFAELVEPFFAFLYESWWRVKVEGAERVPAHGRVLLSSNHAGILPWDATMISMALLREHPAGRGLSRGRQGHGQAVLRALPAPALRPRWVRGDSAAHRRADRAGGRGWQ
jgi:hypothetical protein